ncbi:MAG: glycosyltransferase family 39 protein [Spirochaetia bacterium]|jgi:hypothetical protein|nr:glycosyltransferase family 39 protein [Spirochaetia bacterium]
MTNILNRTTDRLLSRGAYLTAAVVIFTLIIRLVTLQFLDDSGDSKYYIDAAKQLSSTLPYEFTHWSARFGIVIPVYFIRSVWGGASASYILPLLYSLLAAFLVMKTALLMNKAQAGFIAAMILAIYPGMARSGSQILPGIFSMVYLLAALYFILRYVFKRKNILYLVLSAVFTFFAYETHIINVFFAPGMALIIILNKKNPWKAAAFFFGLLLVLYFGETILYHIFTKFSLGRLDIIRHSHLDDNKTLQSLALWELPFRFVRPGPLFLFFFLLSAYYAVLCRAKKKYATLSVYLPAGGFFLIMLFSLRSVSPLVPALPLDIRYMDVSLPFIFLFASFYITERFKAEQLKALSAAALFLAPLITAGICYKNILHHPLFASASLQNKIDTEVSNYVPFVYCPEDSASFMEYMKMSHRQKQKIRLNASLGIPNPYFETGEEYIRILKNNDYLNAFFVDEKKTSLARTLAFLPDSSPALLYVPRELALTLDWNEYLADPVNPLILIYRRPLRLKEITAGAYAQLTKGNRAP